MPKEVKYSKLKYTVFGGSVSTGFNRIGKSENIPDINAQVHFCFIPHAKAPGKISRTGFILDIL